MHLTFLLLSHHFHSLTLLWFEEFLLNIELFLRHNHPHGECMLLYQYHWHPMNIYKEGCNRGHGLSAAIKHLQPSLEKMVFLRSNDGNSKKKYIIQTMFYFSSSRPHKVKIKTDQNCKTKHVSKFWICDAYMLDKITELVLSLSGALRQLIGRFSWVHLKVLLSFLGVCLTSGLKLNTRKKIFIFVLQVSKDFNKNLLFLEHIKQHCWIR